MTTTLSAAEIARWARTLDEATLGARELDRITTVVPDLALPDAYAIQDEGVALRLARGERVVGLKMGLTSKAKMEQMGVDSPIYGVLTDAMALASGGALALARRIHAKIEPEIAFVVARELPRDPSREDVLAACSGVVPAMEVIDSRYRNFDFRLPDVVADNCSGSAFVIGAAPRPPAEVDTADLAMTMSVDGVVSQAGSSAAIYGHPVDSVIELCRMLAARGRTVPAGSVVLAGASTAAIPLEAGREVRLVVDGLGEVSLRATA